MKKVIILFAIAAVVAICALFISPIRVPLFNIAGLVATIGTICLLNRRQVSAA